LRNASEANNAVNCGYRGWRAGQPAENVVLWTENHPTNLAAWELRRRGAPFEIRMVNFQYGESDDQIADAFIRNIDVNTRFVSYSAISNGKGFRIPDRVMKRIWDHAAGFDHCHVHVDGTMVWGARPVNLEHEPLCHSFVSSCHKWFLGPKETGILYMHPSKVQNFTPSIFAYDYKIEIPEQLPNTALRFELLGQRDDVNIITLALTQIVWRELALGVGSYNPYQRVQELGNYLVDKLTGRQPPERPWELLTPASPDRRWGIVRVSAPRGSKPPLEQWLFDNKIVGGGGAGDEFRLCPHIYNTRADIDRVVGEMDAWRNSR
ncbi:aminotransferase class V-fold PLP-dependent enzyme, partial [Bradyrhizobium oligotrophicum]